MCGTVRVCGACVCGIGAFSGRLYYGWLGDDNDTTTSEPRLVGVLHS